MARKSRKGAALPEAAAPAERVWNTAVYARLSVEDSGRKGTDTIDTQIELVTSYVAGRGYLSLADTYVDNGESGKDFDRPAWIRLMEDIRAGRIDCVAVKDLSRFGRNYIETCDFLEKIFPFMGVRFISVNDGYDSGVSGEYSEGLVIALKNLMNDRHIKDISRKVSSAKKTQRERGEYTGAFAPFGYAKSVSDKGKLVPDEETALIVRDIFKWRAEGMSQAAICKRLDGMGILPPAGRLREKFGACGGDYYMASVWQPRAIKRMIRSRVYLGDLAQGKTRQALYANKGLEFVPEPEWHVTENAHEPIVGPELWEAANAVAEERRKEFFEDRARPALPENIFRGFLACGWCGSKLTRRHNVKVRPGGSFEYYYYGCTLNRQHPENKLPLVPFGTIYDTVFSLVSRKLLSARNMGAVIQKRAARRENPRAAAEAEISRLSRELERVSDKIVRVYENHVDGIINEHDFISIKGGYEREADALRERMEELSKRAALTAEAAASDNRWLTAARSFQNPDELTREMLEALVDRIVVYGTDRIDVKWKFADEFALLASCASEEAC